LAVAAEAACSGGFVANSNVTEGSPCQGQLGTVCPFQCNPGFLAFGNHVCQNYTLLSGVVFLAQTFFGGRCEPLCEDVQNCSNGTTPVRNNVTNASFPGGYCFRTLCFTPQEALQRLARGTYAVWRKARASATGIYSDTVDTTLPKGKRQPSTAHIGVTGMGLIADIVALALGWITRAEAAANANLTLAALAGEVASISIPRNQDGWMICYFNRNTGSYTGSPQYTTFDTGLNTASVIFVREFYVHTWAMDLDNASIALTQNIARLAKKVYNLVRFERFLVDSTGCVNLPNGTNIPWSFNYSSCATGWGAPQRDTYYAFNEEHYTVWLSYCRVCLEQPGACAPNYANMWTHWQNRSQNPPYNYQGYPLVTGGCSYEMYLPQYVCHSFNADAGWQKIFASNWKADRAYFASPAFYEGINGVYGVAAGPVASWCSHTNPPASYEMDRISSLQPPGLQGCKMYSPYAVAAYMPADPTTITGDLLDLLSAGETVVPIDEFIPGDFVMLRKSLLDPSWNQTKSVTMIDFGASLFGLATLWLNLSFFQTYSDHDFTQLAATASEWTRPQTDTAQLEGLVSSAAPRPASWGRAAVFAAPFANALRALIP